VIRPSPRCHALAPAAVAALLVSALGASADPAPTPPVADAVQAVNALHATLLEVMKHADELGYEGRAARIRPVLEATYDFPFMAEKSAGRGWDDLDGAQRAKLVKAFEDLAVSSYAARFNAWGGERFETDGAQQATHDTLVVRSRIVRKKGEPVELDYRLHATDEGHWRIIDVFLNGTVSELAMHRAEYSAVLRREGFAGLIAALQKKTEAQARGEGADDDRAF
jgi:phospholipid transport system substrate-binding protein